MLFSSLFFVFAFLPIVLILYYAIPFKFKNLILLIASLLFYAWGEPVYIFLMMFSIAINYVSGLEIEKLLEYKDKSYAKTALVISVVINLLLLGFYKYYGFFLENINAILPINIPYHKLALPIGISFYTFQIMSYVIDVYRGKVKASHNIVNFGAYVSMFPQLIAGPIVLYSDIEKQLNNRTFNVSKFGNGTMWFIRGLAKKVIIANNVGAIFDNINALGGSKTSAITAWIGIFAYTMQIYFDFSGYSDMAIGLGKMLGFEFNINFNYPYTATSITDFWRRWHISLSGWFREYVYIPLGGNRCSKRRHIFNLLVVWCLTGFWHGAAWNFMFWGLYYGGILILEKYVWGEKLKILPNKLKHIYSMVLVMIGWVFFSSNSLGEAFRHIGYMFGIGGNGIIDASTFYFIRTSFVIGLIAIICSTPYPYAIFFSLLYKRTTKSKLIITTVYGILFVISIAYLVSSTYNPFLYFRF